MARQDLTFLKLGGSLITDKDQPNTALLNQVASLLDQIASWRQANPAAQLLLGHGSGSFGHHAAARYHTRGGVHTSQDASGFQAVWHSARSLNQIVIDQAQVFHLPLISFPPSACVTTNNRKIHVWNLQPIQRCLDMGLIPLVYGDAVTDCAIGGTILSTEDLFVHLTPALKPSRILLAGKVSGVFADFPHNHHLIPHISSQADLRESLHGSASQDVTGGMLSKVQTMQALCQAQPGLTVQIFSASHSGALRLALDGSHLGTLIQ